MTMKNKKMKKTLKKMDSKKLKKKKKRRRKAPKRRNSFDLTGLNYLVPPDYNALKDKHLQSFFVNMRIRSHLKKQNLITRHGYIVEKPEEYRKNRKLLREHYKSTSPMRKKGK